MKAQSIWRGHDYAYIPSRGRNERFSFRVVRIKVKGTYQEKSQFKKNASTWAEVELLDWSGLSTGRTIRVRAYDIVDFWNDFYSEYSEKLEAYLVREREQAAAAKRREQEKIEVLDFVKNLNHLISTTAEITIGNQITTISLSTKRLKEIIENERIAGNVSAIGE